MAMNVKIAVQWEVMLQSLIKSYHCFKGIHSCTLKMEPAGSSKALVTFHETAWHHNPEDNSNLNVKTGYDCITSFNVLSRLKIRSSERGVYVP
jgi:hypothetical protein